jgi:acyl-CoA thioesterase YciA
MSDAPVSPPERMPDIRVTVMAADANPYGTAFVGWLFGQMSLAGGSLASRRTGKRAPVVAADGFKFLTPADIGDELSVWAEVVGEGRTSLTIATQAWKRDRHGEAMAKVAEGRFVFVGVGDVRQAVA